MRKVFQPLLWALVGAGIAGGAFFLVNQPQDAGITILVSSPTPIVNQGASPTPDRYLIDINLAPAELLDSLPGIGPVKAQAIVDHRTENGPFHRIDELMKVPGIGAITYKGLRDLVMVGETP